MKNQDGKTKKYSDSDLNLFENVTGSAFENAVSWHRLVLCQQVYPEHTHAVKNLIERRLGYLPAQSNIIGSEPDLRILYQQYRFGQIETKEFYKSSDKHIKHIRNVDLQSDYRLFDHPNVYADYARTFLPYLQMARKRIQFILKYDPPLEYSLAAEIWLSQILAKDDTILLDTITATDYRVIYSIKYRETYLKEGETAARNFPLLALKMID